jgi:UDP-N-acetyl-D-mannosaminuronic acid dehydrogenase
VSHSTKATSEELLARLQTRIVQQQAVIGVIGLGYVGLPVASSFAAAGFRVVGVDIQSERVSLINEGCNPIEGEEPGLAGVLASAVESGRFRAYDSYEAMAEADIVLICVQTPVDTEHKPRYEALKAACKSLGPFLKRGALVIVESTTAPGTVGGIVCSTLEIGSGGQVNRDFFLGACPERVMPGRLLANLRTMSRVCGGSSPQTAEVMVTLYRNVVQGDLDRVDLVTAEMVKTTENAYRDVQIAFANEVALICETAGADVWKVRELVNKSPGRHMLYPGAGVGGHCIPKDPWLLAHAANQQAPVRLIPAARAVNDGMPLHMVQLTIEALAEASLSPQQARVLVLGYAYLENSDDTRNTPSQPFVERMRELGADVRIHDPWVEVYRADLADIVCDTDAVVIMVAHADYKELDLDKLKSLMRTPVLVDGRDLFKRRSVYAEGFIYRGVGYGNASSVGERMKKAQAIREDNSGESSADS